MSYFLVRVLRIGSLGLPLLCVLAVVPGCKDNVTVVGDGIATGEDTAGAITITDRTGKEWDVTHAVNAYGFVASEFQFGLGPNAIRPIFDPEFLSRGDDGYPDDGDGRLVLGVEIDGDARAYSLQRLRFPEVINDRFGDAHVAVAY